MSFRDNLKLELKYQDIQMKELARMTGISKNTLENYITGHNSIPKADSAVKIAQALGVTVEYLVTEETNIQHKETLSVRIHNIVTQLSTLDKTDIDIVEALIIAMKKRYK